MKEQPHDRFNPHEYTVEKECCDLINELRIWSKEVDCFNVEKVKKRICKLKPKKSSGCDRISNYVLKKLPPEYLYCLANCLNTGLKEPRYSDFRKVAKIGLLNKLETGLLCCDQTRTISYLATHSKIFERIMLNGARDMAQIQQPYPTGRVRVSPHLSFADQSSLNLPRGQK